MLESTSAAVRLHPFIVMLIACLVPGVAWGQCADRWVYGPEQGWSGTDGTVYAQLTWDPDGAGPQGPVQVVGGTFATAGRTAASRIAAWNGADWQAQGSGMAGSGATVYALAAYNGELIAGGHFTTAGGVSARNIARWNGSVWQPLAGGLQTGDVLALTVYNGELIAGGEFTSAGGAAAAQVAAWNGTAWRVLGGGVDGVVRALTVYQNELIVAGGFTTVGGAPFGDIARWDGSAWHTLGPGMDNAVWALTTYNGDLVAAGDFVFAGGNPASRVAKWNGSSWSAFAGTGPPNKTVYALAVQGNDVIVGGRFDRRTGGVGYSLGKWSGGSWGEIGTVLGEVRSLGVYPDAGGGPGTLLAGTTSDAHFYRQGEITDWIGVGAGLNGTIRTSTEWNDRLVVGGEFYFAGGEETGPLASWNGLGWESMNAENLIGDIRDIDIYNGDLIVVGFFHSLGGAVQGVARWDGAAWEGLGSGIPGGQGWPTASAVYHGELIVGGTFVTAGGVTVNGLARWNGASWSAFGAGPDGDITALAVYNDELIASGVFTSIDGVALQRIARWDGAAWRPLDTGLTGAAVSLLVDGSDLIACGAFTTAGGVTVNRVARWDGTSWSGYGGGVPGSLLTINSVARYDGELVAGGVMTTQFGVPIGAILRRWNGGAWVGMDSQIAGSMPGAQGAQIQYLTSHGPELVVSGRFTSAGGQPSAYWARWSATGMPWIAEQPADVTAVAGGEARFNVTPTSGYDSAGSLSYRWRRNGLPVLDGQGGASGEGGVVSGATSASMQITAVQPSDAGVFDVIISSACGGVSSTAAVLAVTNGVCAADLNMDGLVDFADFLEFLNFYDVEGLGADFNGDGLVDFGDYLEFLNHYDSGC